MLVAVAEKAPNPCKSLMKNHEPFAKLRTQQALQFTYWIHMRNTSNLSAVLYRLNTSILWALMKKTGLWNNCYVRLETKSARTSSSLLFNIRTALELHKYDLERRDWVKLVWILPWPCLWVKSCLEQPLLKMLVCMFIQKLQICPFPRLQHRARLQDILYPAGTDSVIQKIVMFPWVCMH